MVTVDPLPMQTTALISSVNFGMRIAGHSTHRVPATPLPVLRIAGVAANAAAKNTRVDAGTKEKEMRIRSCAYLYLFAVLVSLPTVCVADKRTDGSDIKVFIFTAGPDEGELVTPQTVARHKEALDSVEDLKKQLAKKLEVTDKRDAADVTIEVLARGAVKPGTTTPSRDTTKDGSDGVHVSLASGDYRTELAGSGTHDQIIGARTAAAKDVSNKIEEWIGNNHHMLMVKRRKAAR
jgi:hypothetical protein